MDFKRLAEQYKTELLDGVLPFWLEKSQDREFGGYFTCLNRDGSVYDTDKFIWLQGREVWMFAMLYNKVERRPEWLECAVQGAEFLRKYGHDGNYNWYFALTREGRPLVQPYNIFSYTFAAMAFAQVAVATGSDEYALIAKRTFDRILEKRANPKGEWCKAYPGTRSLKSFALPMILCNMALEIEPMIDKQLLADTIGECLHEVMEVFYREELGLIVENVTEDGQLSDTFEGRQMNPGHSLEAMWFIMNLGVRLDDRALIDKAVRIALNTAEYGWDKEYGGIFYFLDRKGAPRVELEWDQKLYRAHIISGHTHTTFNQSIAPGLYEHVTPALSGAWWQGPLCTDGTPAGYGVYEVNGDRIDWYYKSTGYPADYQMKIYSGREYPQFEGYAVANVWASDPAWEVEFTIDGVPVGPAERFQAYDPAAKQLYSDTSQMDHKWIYPSISDHYYRVALPEGAKRVEVSATDRFGRISRAAVDLK